MIISKGQHETQNIYHWEKMYKSNVAMLTNVIHYLQSHVKKAKGSYCQFYTKKITPIFVAIRDCNSLMKGQEEK